MKIFIKPDQNIIQVNSQVYIISTLPEFIANYQKDELICKELFANSLKKRASAKDCFRSCPVYTQSQSLFRTTNNTPLCDYQGTVDLIQVVSRKPIRFLPNSRFNPKLEYLAALDSCVIMDSFFELLQQEGVLDEFLVPSASPEKYPTISQVYGNFELELRLSGEYKLLKKRQKSIG